DSGKVQLKVRQGVGKKVRVDGFSGVSDLGRVTKSAKASGKRSLSLKLTSKGRQLLSGCSVDYLKPVAEKSKKKGKKKGKRAPSAAPLDRDLAVCSVGSENPTARPYYGPPIDTSNADRCDFMDPALCLQPWPNDYFTKADPSTDTGRRLNLNTNSMPANKNGVHIDPTDINRGDGFSPGNLITVKIPQVETQAAFDNTGFVPINDLHRYSDPNQPIVVIDAATGERQPVWAELDANPNHYSPGDTQDVNVIIRPARNFEEGHRYIVALRGLRDAQNNPVDPPLPFRVYRDRLITTDPAIENRRPHMEDLISTLQSDGIQRSNLYMTWDFTVASEHSLAGRALAIRDDALHQLGDDTPGDGVIDGSAPTFHITSVQDAPDPDVPANTLRLIDGELTDIPCYLNNSDCHPGGTFNFQSNGDVNATSTGTADDPDAGTTGVRFQCVVPNSAVTGTAVNQTQSGIFGHGLLGDFTQVDDMIRFTPSEANVSNTTWCATNWAGFSSDDIGTVLATLGDVSNFSKATDRMVQGFVNMIYLGRAMMHPDGFDTDPAFQLDPDGSGGNDPVPVIDPGQGLYWEGISQGAIMGGALTALEPDLTQSVLDVVGMNYSSLLRRSTDSAQYFELPGLGLYDNYPNQLERPLLLSLMQLLWDRGEANGYAHHMTDDPLPNTPSHNVLLQMAYGDHQVTNYAAEVEARTIGARVETPALDPGRHWDSSPFLGIPAISSYPFSGPSAMVYYDGGPIGFDGNQDCTDENGNPQHGTAPPPLVELAPNPVSVYGCDPHQYPRRSVDGVGQAASWLQPDGFIDQCVDPGPVARPCYSNGYTGP
ncbi:MAG TPA: hypothetical protein VHR38_05490, partial [Solirubrobacterales bacterium]|nr:hypothetical protein [Solirubrobacterales bacterium]